MDLQRPFLLCLLRRIHGLLELGELVLGKPELGHTRHGELVRLRVAVELSPERHPVRAIRTEPKPAPSNASNTTEPSLPTRTVLRRNR